MNIPSMVPTKHEHPQTKTGEHEGLKDVVSKDEGEEIRRVGENLDGYEGTGRAGNPVLLNTLKSVEDKLKTTIGKLNSVLETLKDIAKLQSNTTSLMWSRMGELQLEVRELKTRRDEKITKIDERTTRIEENLENLMRWTESEDQSEQEEATRKQTGTNLAEVKTANLAQGEIRCYSCGDKGHIGKDCPGRGKGKLCYKCHKYGHTRIECPDSGENSYKPLYKFNNTRGRGGFRGSGRVFGALKRRLENKDENGPGKAKRGRFDRTRGRGSYGATSSQGKAKANMELNKDKGESNHLNNIELNKGNALNIDVQNQEGKFITKFLADSGATEHLTYSKLIFRSLDEKNKGIIKCTNKNETADLRTEGVGEIEIELLNGQKYVINEVVGIPGSRQVLTNTSMSAHR
ncbi:uncharacterized protein LOC135169173 isoform X2 [Diachasmimorpha longicaudata]|uniref:uncharacterized protein LOC135169173 isoform X2 n=1 Tax=Diachasmimorpha longicaudata TaxID=58733 RepID=UPI0030B8CA90